MDEIELIIAETGAKIGLTRAYLQDSSIKISKKMNANFVSKLAFRGEASLQVVTALFFIFATAHYEDEDHRFLPNPPDVRTKLIDRAYTCGLFLYNSPEFVDRLRELRTNEILSDLQEISDRNSNFQ